MARLVIVEGDQKGKAFPLSDMTRIGRLKSNDITVRDSKTSRTNSRIVRKGELFLLEDLDSSNGTFLNDEPIEGRIPLKTGDRVGIGKVVFRFEPDAAKRPTPPRKRAAPAAPSKVATMETPPAGVPAPKPKPADVAFMETPPGGAPAPAAASPPAPPPPEEEEGGDEVDFEEITLDGDDGEPAEVEFEGLNPTPEPKPPPPPPVPRTSPAGAMPAYDLTPAAGRPERRRGLLGEDVGQRDWRFQWLIAAAVLVVMALLFFAAFKLSASI